MASKPNIIIFGGLDIIVSALIKLLVPPLPAEPLICHMRIVDKFSLYPPTTYVSKATLKTFQERKDVIEYRQANLQNQAVVSKAFSDPSPNGQPYVYLVDTTGDLTPGRPPEIYVANTFNVTINIARAAHKYRNETPGAIKAYIRVAPPWYKHTEIKKRYKESDPDGWIPRDQRCVWWNESIRVIGSLEGLPVIVLRTGFVYGEGFSRFEIVGLILLGLVYKHLGEEMKLLWSPELPKSSINVADMAGITWAAANWMSSRTRNEANALIGAPFVPCRDESVTPDPCPHAMPASAGTVIVPAFNMVDEGDSTQASVGAVIGKVYGIKTGFHGMFKGFLANMDMAQITEEANAYHLEAWNQIIMNSKPPVPDTPLTPFVPLNLMMEHGSALNCERIKTVLQYKYVYPRVDEKAVRDYINWCMSEGIWPESDLYTAE